MFYFAGTRKPDFSKITTMDYDLYWQRRGFEINKKLKEREVIILGKIHKNSKVLDIGCGNSRLPISLKTKGCKVEVWDLSEIVLREFQKLGVYGRPINLEDVTNIPTGSLFDYVILSEVLEHTRNPEEIIKTISKFSKYIFITIPNSAFYRYRLHLLFFGRFFTQWVFHPSEHLRFWSHRDFLDWLKAMGFKLEFYESSNGFSLFGLPLYRWWPNMFGHQICYLVSVK